MYHKSSNAIGPHLLLVLLLFVAAVVAPRSWRSLAVAPFSPIDTRHLPDPGRGVGLPDDILAAADDPIAPPMALDLQAPSFADLRVQVQSPPARSTTYRRAYQPPAETTQDLLARHESPTVGGAAPHVRSANRDVPVLAPPAIRQAISQRRPFRATSAHPDWDMVSRGEAIANAPGDGEAPSDGDLGAGVPSAGGQLLVRYTDDDASDSPASDSPTADPLVPQAKVWPTPTTLVSQFEQLTIASWRDPVLDGLRQLADCRSWDGPDARQALATLEQLEEVGGRLAAGEDQEDRRAELLRAQYALRRRLDIWLAIQRASRPVTADSSAMLSAERGDVDPLEECLQAVEQKLAVLTEVHGWRRFLMLDQLWTFTTAAVVNGGGEAGDRPELGSSHQSWRRQGELAREVLQRISDPQLSGAQTRLLQQDELVRLAEILTTWCAPAIDFTELLQRLERFELGDDAQVTGELARDRKLLAASMDPRLAEIGRLLDMHYRNANTRLVLTDEFLQRFMPQNVTQRERIRDIVAGTPVVGRGKTRTNLFVRLSPHASRWQMGIEAVGEVDTDTRSTVGPATFYNQGRSSYRIRKPVVVDAAGVRTRPAAGSADTQSQLSGLETDFDTIPLIGLIVQATAQRRYEEQLPGANREVREQVAQTAAERLDEEVQQRLDEATRQFNAQVLSPLERLHLQPTPVELTTRQNAVTGRFRLAGDQQLAAFTPRPRALSHSLLTLQVHESAVNNGLQSLQLQGTKSDLPGLFRQVAAAVGQPDAKVPQDLEREEAVIQFADEQPIRVRFADGRMEITLHIAELQAGDRRPWRELVVRAFYQPVTDARCATLERDGYIQLSGERLRLRDQIALRGVFSKMFPRHPELNQLSEQVMQRPQLADTQVEQFVIRDGWIGLAITPLTQVAAGKARQQGGIQQ
jgi:hypothetical protein